MKSSAASPTEYLTALPPDRQEAMAQLRASIVASLPKGFEETMSYGMISYVIPHSLYPAGYHCDPLQPLPFMSIASQKNFIAVYHMGIYTDEKLMNWFTDSFQQLGIGKLDMGKSCIRFKKINQIPLKLVGELAGKMSATEWIALYESAFRKG